MSTDPWKASDELLLADPIAAAKVAHPHDVNDADADPEHLPLDLAATDGDAEDGDDQVLEDDGETAGALDPEV